jgi:serine/threonine protein kinase
MDQADALRSITDGAQYRSAVFIDQGSFGLVFRVCFDGDAPWAALKLVSKQEANCRYVGMGSTINAHTEAEICGQLSHPNIVRLFKSRDTATYLQMWFEYVAGGMLLRDIIDHGRLPSELCKTHMKSLFQAVEYLHNQHLAHRDIKPENILLTSRNRTSSQWKLCDFGLAKHCEAHSGCSTRCGSEEYMAPEVWMMPEQDEYGGKADIWSCGLTLFVALTARNPWRAEALLPQICAGCPLIDEEIRTTVDMVGLQCILQCLKVQPRCRPTASEMLQRPWLQGP